MNEWESSWESSWQSAWADLGLQPPASPSSAALLERWSEPGRKYHAPQHLRECLVLFDRCRSAAEHPGEVALALWFHDAVYDIARHDNERRSAQWAQQTLQAAGASAETVQRMGALIMATAHRVPPETADECLLVDIDLAILGADTARFDDYEAQIRDEYRHVPGFLFKMKRRAILQGFLDRPRIYRRQALHDLLEEPARSNLARALAALGHAS